MNTSRKLICLILIILFAGGAFLTGYAGVMSAREKVIKENYIHDYSVVAYKQENSKGKDDYIFTYSVDGKLYEEVYNKANSKTYIGETLDFYYEADNPENYYIATGKLYKYLLIEGILVTVFAVVILALLIAPVVIKHKLIKENKWAMCKVVKVKRNSKTTCRIYCDSSKFPKRKGKPFVSAPYKGKLPKSIKEGSLMVYYNEKNPNFYYVETDKLS